MPAHVTVGAPPAPNAPCSMRIANGIKYMFAILCSKPAATNAATGKTIATAVIGVLGDKPSPTLVLVVLFGISCTLTQFMSNTATTALLAPIAVSISQAISADPHAVLMAIVIGGSCAYATPIGMPANTMVYNIAGYTFMDYVKVGAPLVVISTIVSLILLPIFFPFYP